MSENGATIETREIVGAAIAGLAGAAAAVSLLISGIRRAPWDFAGSEPVHLLLTCPIYLGIGAVIGAISTFLAGILLARFLRRRLSVGLAILIGFLAAAILIFLVGLAGWDAPRP